MVYESKMVGSSGSFLDLHTQRLISSTLYSAQHKMKTSN